VHYTSQQTESSSELYASDLSLLMADALCEKMVLEFEPMTYGFESECATRHDSAPRTTINLSSLIGPKMYVSKMKFLISFFSGMLGSLLGTVDTFVRFVSLSYHCYRLQPKLPN